MKAINQLKARSPAKLILSGEHAVLYGCPALAMAVNCYAESTIRHHFSPSVFFNFLNLKYAKSFTISTLYILKQELQDQYQSFLEGKLSIREVLKRPFELLQFTVTNLLEKLNVSLTSGLEIHTTSDIPIGCGMGSSAAIVMSTLFALAKFFRLEIDPSRFLSLGIDSENLQHGRSSGLDLHLAMRGGCLKFDSGKTEPRSLPHIPMSLVQTGSPISTTGECVSFVKSYFEQASLKAEFANVTENLDTAMLRNDLNQIQECIRENHKLLVKIGVVPLKVQQFVESIESLGGAAKICGAGTVAGDNAGVVLVVSNKDISSVINQFQYTMQPVEGDLGGTRLII